MRMWKWAFARATHAARARNWNYINVNVHVHAASRIPIPKVPLSTSNLLNQSTRIRFFSQIITDSTLHDESSTPSSVTASHAHAPESEGSLSLGQNDSSYASNAYEIDEDKLASVLSLLQTSSSAGDGSLSLDSCLDDMDLTPQLHPDFVIKVIENPLVFPQNLIGFFRWAWNQESFNPTTPVVESLVLAICSGLKKKQIYALWDLLKEIGEKETEKEKESGVLLLDVHVLNQVIISFSKLGEGKAALEAFHQLEEAFQCAPNADTYYFTIEALCKRMSTFDSAWSICEKMLDAQTLPDGDKVGKMLSWFCKGKMAKEAYQVYVAAMEKRKHPPMSSVNFLVAKLCQENETVKLALQVLNDIPPGEGRKRAIKPFSAVVRALCRIKDVDAAKHLILKMIAEGPPPGNAVFNFVVTGYAKVGEMGQAVEMMKLMESRGLKPDLYAYTVLMSGYSNVGEMEEARKILAEAKKKHVKLSPVMYHTLIRGYCKLEQFDEALKLLTEMKDFGVRPNVDEYEKLIQSLCLKALDWEMAEKLQEEMKENGLHLKGITRGLIRAVKEMEKEVVDAGVISSAS